MVGLLLVRKEQSATILACHWKLKHSKTLATQNTVMNTVKWIARILHTQLCLRVLAARSTTYVCN